MDDSILSYILLFLLSLYGLYRLFRAVDGALEVRHAINELSWEVERP